MEKEFLVNEMEFNKWAQNLRSNFDGYIEAEREAKPLHFPCVVSWCTCYNLGRFEDDYIFYIFIYLDDFNIGHNKCAYQIRLWCSDDSCEEFWFDKELSPLLSDRNEADALLSQYEGKTSEEIERMCGVVSVRSNRPRIDIIDIK